MKNLLFLLVLLIFSTSSTSQTYTPDVIVSSGGNFTNDYAQISWTLGDFQIDTYDKAELILTQGFLQTEFKVTNIFKIKETPEINIKVFPNPVTEYLNIQIQSEFKNEIYWEIYNQKGQVVKKNALIDNNISQIDFSPFKNGIYYVRVYDKRGTLFKVFKLVYLN